DGGPFTPLQVQTSMDSVALNRHPLVRLHEQEAAVAEAGKRVEVANMLPDLLIGYGNQSLIGVYDFSDVCRQYSHDKRFSYVNVGIQFPLTVGASKARIRGLEHDADAARADAAQQALQLRA